MDEWEIAPPAILNVIVVLASFGIIANIVIQPVRATVSFLNKGNGKWKNKTCADVAGRRLENALDGTRYPRKSIMKEKLPI